MYSNIYLTVSVDLLGQVEFLKLRQTNREPHLGSTQKEGQTHLYHVA